MNHEDKTQMEIRVMKCQAELLEYINQLAERVAKLADQFTIAIERIQELENGK